MSLERSRLVRFVAVDDIIVCGRAVVLGRQVVCLCVLRVGVCLVCVWMLHNTELAYYIHLLRSGRVWRGAAHRQRAAMTKGSINCKQQTIKRALSNGDPTLQHQQHQKQQPVTHSTQYRWNILFNANGCAPRARAVFNYCVSGLVCSKVVFGSLRIAKFTIAWPENPIESTIILGKKAHTIEPKQKTASK